MLIENEQGFPSHGRGRRFDPYSAHHFTGIFSAPLGTSRNNPAPFGTSGRGQRVDGVPRSFPDLLCRLQPGSLP